MKTFYINKSKKFGAKKFLVNVALSLDETYADITPVRVDDNAVTALVWAKITFLFIIVDTCRKYDNINSFFVQINNEGMW